MNIYYAHGIFTPEQIKRKSEIYSVLQSVCEQFDDRPRILDPFSLAPNIELADKARKDQLSGLIFNSNITALLASNCIIADVTDLDPGVLWELGFFYSNQKIDGPIGSFIIIISENERSQNIMLRASSDIQIPNVLSNLELLSASLYNSIQTIQI